ncbi:uncharacterized [Tachysurus ichikawai]
MILISKTMFNTSYGIPDLNFRLVENLSWFIMVKAALDSKVTEECLVFNGEKRSESESGRIPEIRLILGAKRSYTSAAVVKR